MNRLASLCLLLALAGCGNKGPLVMPDPASADAATPATTPVVAPVPEPASAEPADGDPPATTDPMPVQPVPSTNGTPAR